MPKVTGLITGKRNKKRVNVFLDGSFAFSLQAEVAVGEGLRIGAELSDEKVTALAGADRFRQGLDAALRYLAYRPRSKVEIREKLHRRGFDEGSINGVINRLEELNLVDDAAFARMWLENRQTFRPRSRRLIGIELNGKGISREIIDSSLHGLDDAESAYHAGADRARRLVTGDYGTFRRRLGDFLRRRGFHYEVISETVNRLWSEKQGDGN